MRILDDGRCVGRDAASKLCVPGSSLSWTFGHKFVDNDNGGDVDSVIFV